MSLTYFSSALMTVNSRSLRNNIENSQELEISKLMRLKMVVSKMVVKYCKTILKSNTSFIQHLQLILHILQGRCQQLQSSNSSMLRSHTHTGRERNGISLFFVTNHLGVHFRQHVASDSLCVCVVIPLRLPKAFSLEVSHISRPTLSWL